MDLLTYTKKLAEKIRYYDKLTKDLKFNLSLQNPFKQNTELLVVWVENASEKDA